MKNDFYFENDIIKCDAFEKYKDKIGHGFSTRLGGVSQNEHTKSMNLGFNRGDEDSVVIKNLNIFKKMIGADNGEFIIASQKHTTNVVNVDKTHVFDGKIDMEKFGLDGVDGFVTREKNLILTVRVADCVPIIFADVENGVIGTVHSGWRGTVGKISAVAIEKMIKLGAERENIICAIGTCIDKCCFEVREDFAEEFKKNAPELLPFIHKTEDGDTYHAELKGMNEFVLKEAGIMDEKIFTSPYCTCCKPDIFFSHRYTKGLRGTMCASIFLR